jgi:chitinase
MELGMDVPGPTTGPTQASTAVPSATASVYANLLLSEVSDAQDHDAVVTYCVEQSVCQFAADAEVELSNFVGKSVVLSSQGAAGWVLFQRQGREQELVVPVSRLFGRPVLRPPAVNGLRFVLGAA